MPTSPTYSTQTPYEVQREGPTGVWTVSHYASQDPAAQKGVRAVKRTKKEVA